MEFQAFLRTLEYKTGKPAKKSGVSNALLLLKLSTQKAAETLLLLLDNDDPRIRLIASEKILANAFKGFELYEIEERISSLETMINQPSSEQG